MDAVIVGVVRIGIAVYERAGAVLRNEIPVLQGSAADLAIMGPGQANARGIISIAGSGATWTDADIITEESMVTSILGADTVPGYETAIGFEAGDGECFDGAVGGADDPEAVAGPGADTI